MRLLTKLFGHASHGVRQGMSDEEIEVLDPLYVREKPGIINKDTPVGTWWWRTDFGNRSRRVTYLGMVKGHPALSLED